MAIEKRTVKILGILATIWGTGSKKVYIYLHGQGGNKEEASLLASIVCAQGWQVVSFDLPQHGERTQEEVSFVPWHIIPELHHILRYVKQHWTVHALFANSIGAWFSMLSFANEKFSHGLFVSPILDMKYLISNLMQQADVTFATRTAYNDFFRAVPFLGILDVYCKSPDYPMENAYFHTIRQA